MDYMQEKGMLHCLSECAVEFEAKVDTCILLIAGMWSDFARETCPEAPGDAEIITAQCRHQYYYLECLVSSVYS